MTPTLRGAALMTLAMGLFAVEDALIKSLGATLPAAQIIWGIGLGGFVVLATWFAVTGRGVWDPAYLSRGVLMRSAFEAFGTVFIVSALTLAPLALVSAVIQATPLAVALGAAVFLGHRVGWRRWLAILAGFAGVLLILRPGSEAVSSGVWLAVIGMLGLVGRDLATRNLPQAVTGARLSLHAFASLVVAGGALQVAQGAPLVNPGAAGLGVLALCVLLGLGAYLSIVAATRSGDLAVVSSFRYTRMLFALAIAVPIFGERPDGWTLAGVAVVIAAGAFALWREARATSHA
jgi:drug/metabolite transporter (DMT)-like permease